MSLLALSFLILPMSQTTASLDIAQQEQSRLNACIEKSETKPSDAYEDSLAWLGNGNRPKARLCNAIALLALGNYSESAARLEALATAPDAIEATDRIRYMAQAGNAWLSAGLPDAAVRSFSEALKLEPENVNYLKDRAAAYLILENWSAAKDDLNAALELQPGDGETLTMRARMLLATEDLSRAYNDIIQAMALDPENLDILVLRGEIREAIRLREDVR